MKKVIVIGCPGSGKSTFSKKLGERTGLPLHHLDMIYWNEDKTIVCRDVFLAGLREVMRSSQWIIDGNYASSMELRIKECDTVFFLDYPADICIEGVKSRMGILRSDMPWVETETDEEFIDFINNFNAESRPGIIKLLNKYSEKNIVVFNSRLEADEFLEKL